MELSIAPTPARVQPRLGAVAWAVYLGISWTWCIGMFLPVLIIRDVGAIGWFLFAVPNVVGAGAVGWVLRDAGASRQLVEEHRAACVAFSLVTIAFQMFFVAGMCIWFGNVYGVAAFVLLVTLILVKVRSDRGSLAAVTIALLLSIVCAVALSAHGDLAFPMTWNKASPLELLGLGAVCQLGFLLCPYLDLTFHHARQSTTPAGGRFAFTFGFGVVFCAMIVFTLFYARWLIPGITVAVPSIVAVFLGVHIVSQLLVTVKLHAQSLLTIKGSPASVALFVGLALACCIPPALKGSILGFSYFEFEYRLFMSFYGLIFPAYVWLFMVPPRRKAPIPCVITIALAAPFFWLGFIDHHLPWLLPGVAIVLLSKLFILA